MKSAIITLCVSLAIMGLAVWGDISIMHHSNRLTYMCMDIMDDIDRGDMDAARKHCEDIHAVWTETEEVLSYFVCHSNLLDIQEAFVRLDFALEMNDIDHLRFAIALLENEISDIPHLETIRLETIL